MTQATPNDPKATAAKTTPKSATAKPAESKVELPKGYQLQSMDIIGYYDPIITGTIEMIPQQAVLLDGNIESRKTAILIFAELTEPCKLKSPDKNERDAGQVVEGKKGDIVGIWGKYGMKDLRNCCGVQTFMAPNGKKEIKGRPQPMDLFKIGSKSKGTLIPIAEDKREDSAGEETWLDAKKEKAPF
jgi:hypothetical protein